MANLTTAQKNELVKSAAMSAITMPEGTVQFGDFSFAIPVTVDGEQRYAKMVFTSASNKDTKTAPAFNPEQAREDWLSDKSFKAHQTEEKAKVKAEKSKKPTKSTAPAEEVVG